MIRRLLLRWLGVEPEHIRPEPRLTTAGATALAEQAMAADHPDVALSLTGYRMQEGRAVWHFTTATVGSGWQVTVDDATGAAEVSRWGLR